jgi:chromosome segregation ATPase
MDFWEDKDDEYRFKMTDVYREQIEDLNEILPTFKVANATIHFDEMSPHMHVIGVPIIENCKRGMKKQVGKSQVFTKASLTEIQDKMRVACIKSYNKFYDVDSRLKTKQKGRNQDINVNEMGNYREMKKKLEKQKSKLENANKQTKKLDSTSKDISKILDNLKSPLLDKNNKIISNENIDNIKNYIENVTDVTQTVRSVNDLNVAIEDFEFYTLEVGQENRSLQYQLEQKDEQIEKLEDKLSAKEKIIIKLQEEKESLKAQLQKFKGFWHNLMSHLHNRITYDNDQNYKIVSDDLYKNGIFDDNDNEIANNIYKKVTIPDENKNNNLKKKNDFNLN